MWKIEKNELKLLMELKGLSVLNFSYVKIQFLVIPKSFKRGRAWQEILISIHKLYHKIDEKPPDGRKNKKISAWNSLS